MEYRCGLLKLCFSSVTENLTDLDIRPLTLTFDSVISRRTQVAHTGSKSRVKGHLIQMLLLEPARNVNKAKWQKAKRQGP